MKVLTVKQPWASLIIYGVKGTFKDIENRDWELPSWMRGKRFGVHSSKKIEREEIASAMLHCRENGLPEFVPEELWMPQGCILGTVVATHCVKASGSPWFVGDYGFVLREPLAFEKPIPARGNLGFWEFDLTPC